MAENQEVKSKRDAFSERLKAKYPEREYADDEALFGQIGDDYDDYESRLGQYKERESKMSELFAKNPKAAQFVRDMADGKDPWIAVIERVGSDGVIELMNDPDKKAAYEEANKAYVERIAEEQRLEEEYNRNMAESQALREKWDAQYGEETVDAALAVLDRLCKDAIMCKVTQEAFDMALKVVNHDSDVENARSEGTVAGKNAKIEESLRKSKKGDGLPAMGGSGAAPVAKKKGFFDDIPQRKFQ